MNIAPIPISSGSGELVADSEGLGADGGVLVLLAHIYTRTAGGGTRGVLS